MCTIVAFMSFQLGMGICIFNTVFVDCCFDFSSVFGLMVSK